MNLIGEMSLDGKVKFFLDKCESEELMRKESLERDSELILFDVIEKNEVSEIVFAANSMELYTKELKEDFEMTVLELMLFKMFEFGRKFEQERGK